MPIKNNMMRKLFPLSVVAVLLNACVSEPPALPPLQPIAGSNSSSEIASRDCYDLSTRREQINREIQTLENQAAENHSGNQAKWFLGGFFLPANAFLKTNEEYSKKINALVQERDTVNTALRSQNCSQVRY